MALDVGGNWGQSIFALKRIAHPKLIVSFEPNPSLFDYLDGLFRDDPLVNPIHAALSDDFGEMILYVPSYNGFIFDGLASLNREDAFNWLNAERMWRFDPKRIEIAEHKVKTITLDSLRLSPDIIKIDVQGHELAVVRGGIETIRRNRPAMIVEAPNRELVALLADCGLAAYQCVGGRLEEGYGRSSNTLFLTADHYKRMGTTRV